MPDIRALIESALDRVRPALNADGGGIEFVDVDEEKGILRVRFHGACQGCPMSAITLKMGVEMAVQDTLPQIKEVIAVA
jgi:Fe-S cluster biogenesis protein NfuA